MKKYLESIREKPCLICGNDQEVQAHHEPPKKMGGGNSTDWHVVPLCQKHHAMRHGVMNRKEVINDPTIPFSGRLLNKKSVQNWIKDKCESALCKLWSEYFKQKASK